MKTLILALVLTLFTIVAKAEDKNIISLVVGVGPSAVNSNFVSGSSSSSTNSVNSCDEKCKSKHPDSDVASINNTTNTTPSSVNPSQVYGPVAGLLYQRRIEQSVVGVLIQTNSTYSLVMGIGF